MPLVSGHDLVVLDAPGATPDMPGLLLLGGPGGRYGRGWTPVALTSIEGLAEEAVRVLDAKGAAAGGNGTGTKLPSNPVELIETLPGVVFRCGLEPGDKVEFISEQAVKLCGYPVDYFIGKSNELLVELVHPAERQRFLGRMQRAAREGGEFTLELRILCANNVEKWVWLRGSVQQRDRERGAQLDGFAIDITSRKVEEERLEYLAKHDALTNVPNRSLFLEQLARSLQRADRHQEMLACLFIDLDRFKRVNDSFGHACGDEVLQLVAERLKQCVRGNDIIGRLGGDEFTVLLDGIEAPQDAAAAAHKILSLLSEPFVIGERKISMAASIGISCYPGDANDSESLLQNADAAMYEVKNAGRHGYRFYSADVSGRAHETLALANALREAVEADGLEVHYQPRVDLKSGSITGVEALARWHSAEFGEITPARFIPLAEDIGLIGQLGEKILDIACHQAAEWDKQGLEPVSISVNVTARQLRDGELPGRVERILANSGLDARRLELEVSGTARLQDQAIVLNVMRQLNSMGIRLAVDDFGAGQSSLQLLKEMPLSHVKVDRAFIGGVPARGKDVAIAEAIIAVAQRLGLRVVAEGVETKAQDDFARASGCDEAQGNLFSKPLRADSVTEFIGLNVH